MRLTSLLQLKHHHSKWRFLPAILLIVILVSGALAVLSLRQNNLNMIKLREAVYVADKNGGNVEGALQNLRAHVHSHMNTDVSGGDNTINPPIQLKYTYERLAAAEKERVASINAKVYTDAQVTCERQNPTSFSGGSRVPCIEAYVARNGVEERPIADSLYKFDFVSPRWSPDNAGWSLVVFAASLMGLIGALVIDRLANRHVS